MGGEMGYNNNRCTVKLVLYTLFLAVIFTTLGSLLVDYETIENPSSCSPLKQQDQQNDKLYHSFGLYEATLEDRKWVLDHGSMQLPSLVSPIRRWLTLDICRLVLLRDIPGDFIETGTYTGGTSILMAMALERWDMSQNRKLWVADSFEGLPPPQVGKDTNGHAGDFKSSYEVFLNNMKSFGVWNETKVKVLKGWFSATLPTAPIGPVSFLRLDGDLYVSTKDALDNLYSKVSYGGMIYVDDYGSFPGCQKAVDEYREEHGITSPLYLQYTKDASGQYEAVFWTKTLEQG